MALKQARIERRVRDPTTRSFIATGETVDGDVATLEELADTLSGCGGRYLKGPVPWPWMVAAALPGKALIVAIGGCNQEPNGGSGQRRFRAVRYRPRGEVAGARRLGREANRFPLHARVARTVAAGAAQKESNALRKSAR